MRRWMMRGFGGGPGFGAGFGGYGPGPGFGPGAGWGKGNPYPFCRFNPSLPSRRAMAASMTGYPMAGNVDNFNFGEAEYLKNTAEYLQGQLDAINKRLNTIESKEKEE